MQQKKHKGLKPLIIKYMALLMGICYLMNPLQRQINTLLHTLSHELTPPSSILAHENGAHNEFEPHHSLDHQAPEVDHEHVLVDLVSTFFEASSEDDDSNESNFIDVKWDKHITTHRFKLSNLPEIIKIKCFWASENQLIKGYVKKLEEPPQVFFS